VITYRIKGKAGAQETYRLITTLLDVIVEFFVMLHGEKLAEFFRGDLRV